MKNDIHLQQKWLECFPEEEKEEKLVSYNFHCICFRDQNEIQVIVFKLFMMQDWKTNKIENHPWVNLEFNFDL